MTQQAERMETGGLRQGLRRRHMALISIGGVIGAGLFVGSGVVISATGPAAVLSFLVAGVLIVLIMRMLAEMTTARPALGSFYAYAREGLGRRAGFAVGSTGTSGSSWSPSRRSPAHASSRSTCRPPRSGCSASC